MKILILLSLLTLLQSCQEHLFDPFIQNKKNPSAFDLLPLTLQHRKVIQNLDIKKDVVVAVLDSGINCDLFKGKIWMPKDLESSHPCGINFTSSNEQDLSDKIGHGTKVAYIMASLHPNIKIFPIKIFDSKSNQSAYLKALRLVAKNSDVVKVVNYSYNPYFSDKEEEKELKNLEEKKIILVQSAGNEGIVIGKNGEIDFTKFNNVILVGASKRVNLGHAHYSNYHPKMVTIDAPGEFYFKGRKTIFKDFGTSFSAPFVAGVVALALEANPELGKNGEVKKMLIETSKKYEYERIQSNLSRGEIDVEAFLTLNFSSKYLAYKN